VRLTNRSTTLFFVFLAVVLMASSAAGQTQITTGVIQGVVQDETGAVIPGANATIRNLETNFESTVETNPDGRFVFLQLRPGPYTLRVSKQGFSTIIQENLSLTVGQTIPLTFSMKVSPVAEEITVTATPTVDIVKTESSSTLSELSVSNTPVLGRKFEDLFTLTPGVSITQGPDGDEINFVGQRGIFNNISVDGGDYNNGFFGEQAGGQRTATDLTMDAVKEFQVIATGGSAEFGRTAGGVVNVITKSGTNELHGSAFYFQRHEKLSANDSQGRPLEGFEREQVRRDEVGDVDVVTDARAVGRGIVVAVDAGGSPLAERDLQNARDEVAFGVVGFAAIRSRARRVEISQAGVTQAMNLAVPLEHGFDHQLRFAIGVDRGNGRIFGQRLVAGFQVQQFPVRRQDCQRFNAELLYPLLYSSRYGAFNPVDHQPHFADMRPQFLDKPLYHAGGCHASHGRI